MFSEKERGGRKGGEQRKVGKTGANKMKNPIKGMPKHMSPTGGVCDEWICKTQKGC